MTAHQPIDPPVGVKPRLEILLCAPRGFCAGVDRAIQIVELALRKYGPPVYVRHEIVHNKYVVEGLKAKGAVFVEELDEIPDTQQPVIFSAHGVPKAVPASAAERKLFHLDATCPLVSKVHKEAMIHNRNGREIVLVGHAGHPEVIGTMGQLPPGAVRLIETVADARAFQPRDPVKLAWITQTTLSVDDTADIIAVLRERFPAIAGPHKEDICYATTNRQEAVKAVAGRVDAMIVVGSPNSSNSQRLREVAERSGCSLAFLIGRADEIDWARLANVRRLGITAGASAPEILVEEIIDAFAERFQVSVEPVVTAEETVAFNLPRELRAAS
jgi:4-hydroxy-3-methylbut-2-enyl diphosphate reductase